MFRSLFVLEAERFTHMLRAYVVMLAVEVRLFSAVLVREVDESNAHKTRTSMIIRIAVEKVIVYNISFEWDIE